MYRIKSVKGYFSPLILGRTILAENINRVEFDTVTKVSGLNSFMIRLHFMKGAIYDKKRSYC